MCWLTSIVTSCSDRRYTCKKNTVAWSSHSCWSVEHFKFSHLLLLLWCMAICGYHTSSNNSNTQQQLTVGYNRQTSKSLPGKSQPRRVKTSAKRIIYKWQFKYACYICNTNVTVYTQPMEKYVRGYITGIHHQRFVTSCITWNLPQSIRILKLLSRTQPSAYFAIIDAADNSQVKLANVP